MKPIRSPAPSARDKLLDAALGIIRAKGYAATSVDDLCKAAHVTKGAFFHHFATKEALAVAVAKNWSQVTSALFASAPYHDHADPVDRVLSYIDFRTGLIDGPIEAFTCLVGTMVQETYQSSDPIRAACDASITDHATTLEADLAEAMQTSGVSGTTAKSLALHTQAVLQGAFIIAKAQGNAKAARESAAHLKHYFEMLFKKE